ncbi:MAG: PAS domain-containing protein, partial [Campylobacterota bacterium]
MIANINTPIKKLLQSNKKLAAFLAVISFVLVLIFLCYLNHKQYQMLTENLHSEVQNSIFHITDQQVSKHRALAADILDPLYLQAHKDAKIMRQLEQNVAKVKKNVKHLYNVTYFDSNKEVVFHMLPQSITPIEDDVFQSLEIQNEGAYTFGYDGLGNIVFRLIYPLQDRGFAVLDFNLQMIQERVESIMQSKAYFFHTKARFKSLHQLHQMHSFGDFQLYSSADRFLNSVLNSAITRGICLNERFEITQGAQELTYLASLAGLSNGIDGFYLVVFKDISAIVKNKNEMFFTLSAISVLILSIIVFAFISINKSFSQRMHAIYENYTKELLVQKKRFETYYQKSPMPSLFLNLEGRITFVNEIWLQELAFRYEEVIRRDILDFMPLQFHASFKQFLQELLQKGERNTLNARIYTKQGKEIDVKLSATIFEQNSVVKIQVSFIDISQEVLQQRMLQKHRTYLHTIFEVQPQMLIVTDGQKMELANNKFLEFVEFASIEAFAKRHECICDLFVSKNGYLQKYMDGLSWVQYLLQHPDQTHKVLIYKKDTLCTFDVTAQKIPDSEGTKAVVIFADITEDEAIRQRYEFALEGSSDGLWDVDLISKKVYYSPRWKQIIGYDENEIENVADAWWSRIHPDDIEGVKKSLDASLHNYDTKYENIHRLKHKDGNWVWIYTHGKVLFDSEGKPQRMVGVHTDITSLKLQEFELKRLNTVLQNSPLGIVITDKEGVIIFVNQSISQMMGYAQEELLHTKIDTYSP